MLQIVKYFLAQFRIFVNAMRMYVDNYQYFWKLKLSDYARVPLVRKATFPGFMLSKDEQLDIFANISKNF